MLVLLFVPTSIGLLLMTYIYMYVGSSGSTVDPMVEVILVIGPSLYFNSNPALTPLQKIPFQLSKMPKIRDFDVDF